MVEGSYSFQCENWNNLCRAKKSLIYHYTVFHDLTANLQAVHTITNKNRLKEKIGKHKNYKYQTVDEMKVLV